MRSNFFGVFFQRYVCERTIPNNQRVDNNKRIMVTTNGPTTNTTEHMITLNIHIPREKNPHSMQFDVQMLIGDICENIQQYLPIKFDHDASEYGLFINDLQQSSRSYWLDPTKTLNYYLLKNHV